MTYGVRRLNHVASTKTSNVDKKSLDGETAVKLCNYTDVYKNASITTNMDFMVATATKDQVSKFGLKAGDTVFTKDSETADDIGIPAYVAESAPDLVCGYHLAIARPYHAETNPRFLYWCLASPEAAQQWSVLASGVTRVGLRQADIGKLEVPCPPLDIQGKIAAFLDRETAQIDDLIGKQEQLIELLAEKRQAVITHAVTKGLDPSAPTKASGVPWLGDLPMHWTEKPMCHFMAGRVDYRGATPQKTDQGIFLVTARNVRKGFIDYAASSEYIAPEDYDSVMSRGMPAVGDILMTMEAPLGNVALVDDPHVALAQRVVKFRPKNELVSEFAAYAMNSPYFRSQLESRATGSTALGLKASKLIELRLAAPPRTEQQQIVEHLNGAILRIDTLLQRAESAIGLLQERRSALISAAVTGKINVQKGAA